MEKMTQNTTNSADSGSKIASFKAKQNMPYDFKVNYAKIRAREFYNECGKRDLDCYVSVGGLDSITLLLFLRSIGIDVPAVSVSSLEDVGLMASEGGRREKALMLHGCNYFGQGTIRSAPFAIFNRQDLLQLALDLDVPVPEIYGSILKDENGNLYTSEEQRTGCSMCGFGIQLEKRPHRFDRLRERNYKEWDFWMNRCCVDEEGKPYGWGKVLDYLGIGWKDVPEEYAQMQIEQMKNQENTAD